MALLDFKSWSKSCDNILTESPGIITILNNAEFVYNMRIACITAFGDTVRFGKLIRFLTNYLNEDENFERVVRLNCAENFTTSPNFTWFCFWCSIIMYGKIKSQIGNVEGG